MKNKFLKLTSTLVLAGVPILSSVACSSQDNDDKKFLFNGQLFSTREKAKEQLRQMANEVQMTKVSALDFLFLSQEVGHSLTPYMSIREQANYFISKIHEFYYSKFDSSSLKPQNKDNELEKKIEQALKKIDKETILKFLLKSDDISQNHKPVVYKKHKLNHIALSSKNFIKYKTLLEGHISFFNINRSKIFLVKSPESLKDGNTDFFSINSLAFYKKIMPDLAYNSYFNFNNKRIYFDSFEGLLLWIKEQKDFFDVSYDYKYYDFSSIFNGYNPKKKFTTIEEAAESEIEEIEEKDLEFSE